ncbi:hypothetical protein E6C27_scaffold2359G00030 [Cucumis melo var. makuwa]|uniref:Uncharacterized protein n=1 Tax=Cucumis melo var. makuwa TaxID=1194695 RepID=A0A5A7UJ43_CUCMM|nr:hypothetical protein E6C27_scaffold2359G00030 [Cucumis melo var. makuwa]
MSSLSKEGSRSIVWSCSEKHTFEMDFHIVGRKGCTGLGWEPKPKTRKMASASSATTLTQSMVELQLWFELDEAKRAIEEHTRKQDMLASQVEQMWKVIEDMTPAQPRPPYDP